VSRTSPSHREVLAANVREHAAIAVEYERRTREVATTPALWNHWYFEHLRLALDDLRESQGRTTLTALDALGGSGKTGLFLQQHGVKVTLCDVSVEMTDIYAKITRDLGHEPKIVIEDIESYLNSPATPQFSLITASSALHHLHDYKAVVAEFYNHLEPGGFLHTAWDPLPRGRAVRILGKAEYYLSKAPHPAAALRGARRRATRLTSRASQISHEFHKSIDDGELIRFAEKIGFVVRIHHRNAAGSLHWTRPLWQRARAYTSFALLLQRPVR
jgi:SAM-dependent methyltransferase